MSEHHLPENLKHWPDDPFELLGVRPGVEPRELKRAYTRLIRQYKPEQYPDHFRRIRDAYENAQRFAAFFTLSPDEVAAEKEPAPSDPAPELPSPTPVVDQDGNRPPTQRQPGLEQELDDLWQQACDGNEAAAYTRLVELHRLHPDRSELCVRLYWLLVTAPEVDERRSRCEWLMRGLQASGHTGPLRELYRRECLERPAEALSERFTTLFRSSTPPSFLLEMAEWRWHAASKLQRWSVIVEDVSFFRERGRLDDDELWARLLLGAIDYLAWADGLEWAGHVQQFGQELEGLSHLANRLSFELDRLDFLRTIVTAWQHVRDGNVPALLLDLVPHTWTRPFEELRPPFLKLLTEICREPREWLGYLDQVHNNGSAVLAHLSRLFEQMAAEQAESALEPDLENLRQPIFRYLDGVGRVAYAKMRPKLLAFCLREAVPLHVLAEIVAREPEYFLPDERHLAQALMEDFPLRYVCQAQQLFGE